ncbi:GTP-binding protein [Aquicoccus porphyridii]|uniref:GTP-binding protein n=1 Tax=Aquicoccus porphyridii TaxID=1852029 RepID=A0A5A9ZHM8_9RHOB|nr:CobW family GTP-binding protein [Aquicoccus porphyridii]KAA0916744.1 GTP-binding protein [Aquicoccus porphyridii]RAI53868.1 GTP-binding protein [Rhodobacteraceae bacterium AsT-22]
MSVPVLLVTGFLGAGKTTFINRVLEGDHGLRIAAIVNDFGSINIDAALLDRSAEGVIGLKNGCICCSLQGDLMRTLKLVLARAPKPELIVIEASGVADPAGIVQSLMDPVIWAQARLETVIGIVDAPDAPRRKDDPLWQAQLRGSDILFLSKTTDSTPEEVTALRAALSVQGKKHIFDMETPIPLPALFIEEGHKRGRVMASPHSDSRFIHVEWEHDGPLDMHAFQETMSRLAGVLLRGKGFVSFTGRADRMLFQLVGNRAALSPEPSNGEKGCKLVLIGERGEFDPDAALRALNGLRARDTKA